MEINKQSTKKGNKLIRTIAMTLVAGIATTTPISLAVNASEVISPSIVANQLATPTITPNEFELYTDSYISGTFAGDVKRIRVFVEGENTGEYSGGTVSAGVFQFYARDKIRNTYDKVTVKAYNTAGQEVDSKVLTIKNADGTGSVTVNDFVLRQSRHVEGTYKGNVARVRLKVGTTEYAGGTVSEGKITFYALDKIKDTTEPVVLMGYDRRGNKITEQTVNVTELSGTITANEFELYTDSYVQGTFTGEVRSIKLIVEGASSVEHLGGTVSNGAFQFYAKDKIRNSFDKVTLKAYNAVGREVDSKDISIKNADGAGSLVTTDFALGQSRNVEATYQGNISRVRLKVNNQEYAGGTVANGTATFYALDKIRNITDKVTLIGLDRRGNKITEQAVRIIEGEVNTAPTITGATDKTIDKGTVFNPLEGVSATDKEDGDLTASIQVAGNVDTTKTGVYELIYSVKDSANEEAKVTRKITVQDVVAIDPAAEMVNPTDKVLVGYWHNWPAGKRDGYKQGSSAAMDLTEIRKEYNVIDVSFMKSADGGGIPTFAPYNMTDKAFRDQIGELNKDGRAVIMALGGADAHIELKKSDKAAFVAEIIRMVDVYGFDGLDIDLEQSAITAGENQTIIPEALREVKNHYKAQNKNFLITMAPEFPYLKPGAAYEAYIKGLDGYYDWINPQLYNQSGDGLWVDELNLWLTQSNDDLKAKFLYYMADSFSKGTRGFLHIPADKLVLGIPANNDAAATGYVIKPLDVKIAMDQLEAEGQPIKGLMTWSVNWDAGTDKDGKAYDWEFVNRYAPMLFNETKAMK
ncbi:DUF5011 domain-containing protein [Listeria booriae]|nr:DUF5011 domain-containing protein [Listeria booriae]